MLTDKKSILDKTLSEILSENPWLANMTPRQIANNLLFMKCRLIIPPGHACRQQMPYVTFKSVVIEHGYVFILDSCIWYGERWVIRMGLVCATLLVVSPIRVVQKATSPNESPVVATTPSREVCSCMDIITAEDYLKIT